jgi:outer membrane protein OmpA-like peptidoglycan-associated protein
LFPQEYEQRTRYGIYGSFLINSHNADFQKLPGIPNCCPRFEEGSGIGLAFGALLQFPVIENGLYEFRVGLNNLSGILKKEEPTTIIVDNYYQTGIFEHSLEAKISVIDIITGISYKVVQDLFINFGLIGSIPLKNEFSQKEIIIGTGTFLDSLGNDTQKAVRHEFSGLIPGASSYLLSFNVGLSYELMMNNERTWFLTPELAYRFMINDIAKDLKWKLNQLSAGLSIKYSPKPNPKIIDKEEIEYQIDTIKIQDRDIFVEKFVTGSEKSITKIRNEALFRITKVINTRTDTLFIPKEYFLKGDISAVAVDSTGKEVGKPKLVMEEFILSRLQPLLNYIFFDENSAKIDNRYNKINKFERQNFDENKLFYKKTLETYYDILNIIANRMINNPNAKLKLIGCNDGFSSEKNNSEISSSRANSVKNYLTNVWEIDPKRIEIELRNLPLKASTPISELDKIQENRRVEIFSDNYEILKPLFLRDTLRKSNIPIIRFKPEINSEAGLRTLNIEIKQNEKILHNFSDNTGNYVNFDWIIEADQRKAPKYNVPVQYNLMITDMRNQEFRSKTKNIDFEILTITKKRTEGIADKEIDKYSLILFEFDKADIEGANKKIIDFIKSRIKKNSSVKIEGYTDRTGDAIYNKKLSERRANTTSKSLSFINSEAVGIGEDILLHNNDIPEGRFYCRTVDITVETKIEK